MFAAYQSHLTYDGKNPIEEFLQELRLEIQMSTADIASAFESIMAKWKAISLGTAAFFLLPVMLLMARLSTIYRKKTVDKLPRHPGESGKSEQRNRKVDRESTNSRIRVTANTTS